MSSGISGAQPTFKQMLTVLLKESDDLLSCQKLDAWDGFSVSDGNTNLRWWHTLFGHSDDKLTDTFGSVSNPSGTSSLERSDSWTDTFSLSLALDSTHYYHKSTINIKYFYFNSLLEFYKKNCISFARKAIKKVEQ
jgi:hypothetical protein